MTWNTSDADILGLALGAPARQVLQHAQLNGPKHGWKDGYLSRDHGICPPDPEESQRYLRRSLGSVWSQACARLPALVARSRLRQSLDSLPVVSGTSDTVPDKALWAAATALHTLIAVYRYEGCLHDADKSIVDTDGDDLPVALSVPLNQILKRLGRLESRLSLYDLSVCNYKIDTNLCSGTIQDLRPIYKIFGDDGETRSLTWITRLLVAFTPAVDLIAQCQEKVLAHDIDGLTHVILDLTKVVKDLVAIMRSVNAEDLLAQRCHPTFWTTQLGVSEDFPELSLPVFQFMDALVGKSTHTTSHRRRITALRPLLPINARAFAAAIESRSVGDFVEHSSQAQLQYAWSALVQAYYESHGLIGVYQQKANTVQHLAIRTGQSATSKAELTEGVHASSSLLAKQTFEYCTVRAKISSRSRIDSDQDRTTALVSLLIQESSGLSFEAGDRLLVMPLNSWAEVEKIAAALGLDGDLDQKVPLYGGTHWDKFAQQLYEQTPTQRLTVRDVLRYGHIAPIAREQILSLNKMFHGTCPLVTQLLDSTSWPLLGTLGDVLQIAIEQVSPVIWDTVFDLSHLSWLQQLIPVAEPRPYGISSPALMGSSLPSSVKITVSRTSYEVNSRMDDGLEPASRWGMTSNALNPGPNEANELADEDGYPFMIGVAPVSTVRLRSTPMDNVVMFAESGSVGLFRSFWRSRSYCLGETILFLALRNMEKYPFEAELAQLQDSGQMRVFTALGDENEPLDADRVLSSTILDQGQLVCDLLTATSEGGLGAHLYLSGSLKLYQSILTGIRRALYNADLTLAGKSAESLMASAFAEGRLNLDIYSDPCRAIGAGQSIPLSQLTRKTGHRTNIRSWIAISDNVYDVTDMQRMWPADTTTIRLGAGLDAVTSLSALTESAPAMKMLIPDFCVGSLTPRRRFQSAEESHLFELWRSYLRFAVEALTTLAFETEKILAVTEDWFTTSRGREKLHKFIETQVRLVQNGVSSAFGVILQDVHVRTAFAHVTKMLPDARVPDVMGIVARTRSSKAVAQAVKELHILQHISRSSRQTGVQTSCAIEYTRAVVELELHLMETVVDDLRAGVEVLEKAPEVNEQVTAELLAVLEHVAYRYQAFWERLSLESVSRSRLQKTLQRKKYDMIQKPTQFGRAATVIVSHTASRRILSPTASAIFIDHTVNFAHLVDQAMQTVNEENLMAAYVGNRKREQNKSPVFAATRSHGSTEPTAYDAFHHHKAVKALASFLGSSETAIKRLSQLPADLSFAYIMASYGRNAPNAGNHTRSSSAARSVLRTMDSQSGNDTPRPRLIRRRTNNSSISSAAPQSIFSSPDAATPDTAASGTSSPMPLQLTLRSRERSLSKSSVPTIRQARASSSISRSQPVVLSLDGLAPSTTLTGFTNAPPTRGTTLPALLPSPSLPEKPLQVDRPADTGKPHLLVRWEMPLVSLSKAEKQTSNPMTKIPPPALPLQTMNLPPPPPAIPATIPSESPWLCEKLKQQEAPRAFSAKQLPIITFSKTESHASKTDIRPAKTHWEMPLYTLSKAEMKMSPMKPEDTVRPPVIPLQTVSAPPPVYAVSIPTVSILQATTKPVVPFNARQLPIITLSKKEPHAPRTGIERPAKTHWEMPLYTLSKAEIKMSPTKPNDAIRLPAVPLQTVSAPLPTYAVSQPAVSMLQATTKPIVPFNTRQLPILTLSAAERAWANKQNDMQRMQPTTVVASRQSTPNSIVVPGTESQVTYSRMKPANIQGLWLHPRLVMEAREKLMFGISRTKGYVGLWLVPGSRVHNVDYDFCLKQTRSVPGLARARPNNRETRAVQLQQSLWNEGPPSEARKGRTTRGYVGLWMFPSSKKRNEDFEIVLRGGMVPQPVQTIPKILSKSPSIAAKTGPETGLWQPASEEQTSTSRRTIGYVGMFMAPPSRIRNSDFEAVRGHASLLAASPGTISTKARQTVRPSIESRSLWSASDSENIETSNFTLGSVGMWMRPSSKKVNMDFEQLVVNTVNYLLGSKSSLHRRMAKDMSLVAAELNAGPPGLIDWTALTGAVRGSHTVALMKEPQAPIHPERASQPRGYKGRTLGQVGMWLYPPSKRWNIDFEGFRAATDAAPELESKQVPRQREGAAPQSRTAVAGRAPSGRTEGFVGLWTAPPSRKLNEDFEWAKNHAELSLEEQPTNPMLPAIMPTTQTQEQNQQQERPSYVFLAQSPSISTSHTAAITPTSASTTDGMVRHKIDFEDRLRKLNAELDMEDSGMEDSGMEEDSAVSTPVAKEPPLMPPRLNAQSTSDTSRRPELKQLNINGAGQVNQAGLEILSATRYTPNSSSSSGSSSLLSPHSAARPPRPLRPAQHIWERDIGPSPSQLPPAPLRTQSTKQTSSRVSSVKNMWEKRASVVMEAPLMAGRSRSRSPPEPLKLHRANTVFTSSNVTREHRRDSATIPGFEMLGAGDGHSRGMDSPLLSPMSPGVAAY